MSCTPYSPSVSVLGRWCLAPRGPPGSSRSFSAACASWDGRAPDGCAAPASIDSFFARLQPVTYVLFDALYANGRSLLAEPPTVRRQVLQDLLESFDQPRLVFSAGIIERGSAYFEQ